MGVTLKIAILGAGGVRTPLIIAALARRQTTIGLTELVLMDIDAGRLASIRALVDAGGAGARPPFRVVWTTDAAAALAAADFVVTTFRVGGIASRVADERVPLRYGVLGQETTGPGGFAMAMRTIPVLLDYLALMRKCCPTAWLVNFANPAGLLAQAAIGVGGWPRTIGICDAPAMMRRIAAHAVGVSVEELYLDYFGLNHLGWVRAVRQDGVDHLPRLLEMIRQAGKMPGLPFSAELILALGMIPNEYLFYYYHSREAVEKIMAAPATRGERIATWNEHLFAELAALREARDDVGMRSAYDAYLAQRGNTYMATETGDAVSHLDPALFQPLIGEGYAGVALDAIEALVGGRPLQMILNVANAGAVHGMGVEDVVEVPAFVGKGTVRPLAVGPVPSVPLGLMQEVKAYERLTIAAATEGSYIYAVEALTVHPLVRDYRTAVAILDDYRVAHGALFPELK